jgi:hypothetical protein
MRGFNANEFFPSFSFIVPLLSFFAFSTSSLRLSGLLIGIYSWKREREKKMKKT